MRGMRTAGIGLAVVAAAASAQAADPPAARLGRIQPVEPVQPAGLVVRGQAAGAPYQPPAPNPYYQSAPSHLSPGYPAYPPAPTWPVAYQAPQGGTPPAAGTGPMPGGTLQHPKPLPAPSVTEQRSPSAAPPAATLSLPPGALVPYGAHPGYPPVAAAGAPCPTCADPYLAGGPAILPATSPVSVDADPPLVQGASPAAPVLGPLGLLSGPNRFQLNAEFLLWWVTPFNVPALVTTSSPASAGILGQPGTRVLFGNTNVGNVVSPGGRFGGVYWFGCRQVWGLDGDVFFLQPGGETTVFRSTRDPVLARPFLNVNQGIPFSEFVTAPGLATGSVAISTETSMWGGQVNLRRYIGSTQCARLDAFGGFRYLGLFDDLRINETFARVPGSPTNIGVADALSGTVTDRFRTENEFFGPQLGLAGELRRGRWFAEGRASVAMGTVYQEVEIAGAQRVQFADGGQRQFLGGLLALPGANIGTFRQEKFGVIPEVTLRLGYHLTDHWRFAVGYNFLYLNSVLRPGDQIDPGLDVTRIPNFPLPGTIQPTVGRPAVPLKDTSVAAQGVSFTLTYTW